MHTECWFENPTGTDHLRDLCINGRIVLRCTLGKLGMDWIYMAQNRVQWQVLVNMVMNLGLHKSQGIS
jgi:hypothetical protein